LTVQQVAAPTVASSAPPSAGPTTREALMMTSYRLTADASRSVPTRSITYTCRAVLSGAATVPVNAAMTNSIQARTTPAAMIAAVAAAKTSSRVCVAISSLRRSIRSTRAPEWGPSSRDGRNVHAVSSPRSTPLPVSRSSSHDVATAWVIVPDADSTWLKNHERYAGVSSDRNDRCRLGRVPAWLTAPSA
jgi:hypothetical protein